MPASYVADMFLLVFVLPAVVTGAWTFVEWLIAMQRFRKSSTGDSGNG